jgi:hypothetical protein
MAQDRVVESTGGERGPEVTPAAQPTAETGPGVRRLRELFAQGTPAPKDVVAVLDAHRGERDQILAFLHAHAGNAYVTSVMEAADRLRLSIDRREVVAGDPSDPSDGYFVASAEERGARWRTGDGRFTGRADNRGLDARYELSDDSAIRARVDARERTGTLGLERDGTTVGELGGRYRGGDDWSAGIQRPFTTDGGATITPQLRHHERPEVGGADVAAVGYRDATTTADAYLGRSSSGGLAAGASATHNFDRGAVGGSFDHSPEADRLALSGHRRLTDATTVSGSLNHIDRRHGPDVTGLTVSERTRGSRVVHGLDLSYENVDGRDRVRGAGFIDGQLGNDVYAGAFGSWERAEGERATSRLGASLTFTPSEKTALTLAGVIDEAGNFETRLQFDLFKKRVEGIQAISDNKKSALVSLFLSYTQGGRQDLFDDRFGSSTFRRDTPVGGGGGAIGAGIRIRF